MIRIATPDDAPRLAEIHICSWRFAYRGLLSDHELFAVRQVAQAEASMRQRLANGDRIAVFDDPADGILKGFAWHGKARDADTPDAYELYAVYVQPEFIGNRIGTRLVDHVTGEARAAEFGRMTLWVLEKNVRGRAFYERIGFALDGARKTIAAWSLDELRMARSLAPSPCG